MDLPIHTDEETLVILGVDTHADAHVVVALDGLGRRLGHKRPCPRRRPATLRWWLGRRSLERWSAPVSRAAAASAWEWSASCVPEGWRSSRSTARTASTVAGSVSTTPPTPRPPRGCSRQTTPPPASPRRAPTGSRGDGARPARSAAFGAQGAHTGCQPTARTARQRARRDQGGAARPFHDQALVATAARFRPGSLPKDLRAATKLAMRSVARLVTSGSPRRSPSSGGTDRAAGVRGRARPHRTPGRGH